MLGCWRRMLRNNITLFCRRSPRLVRWRVAEARRLRPGRRRPSSAGRTPHRRPRPPTPPASFPRPVAQAPPRHGRVESEMHRDRPAPALPRQPASTCFARAYPGVVGPGGFRFRSCVLLMMEKVAFVWGDFTRWSMARSSGRRRARRDRRIGRPRVAGGRAVQGFAGFGDAGWAGFPTKNSALKGNMASSQFQPLI